MWIYNLLRENCSIRQLAETAVYENRTGIYPDFYREWCARRSGGLKGSPAVYSISVSCISHYDKTFDQFPTPRNLSKMVHRVLAFVIIGYWNKYYLLRSYKADAYRIVAVGRRAIIAVCDPATPHNVIPSSTSPYTVLSGCCSFRVGLC
jgi:hypothetical protein